MRTSVRTQLATLSYLSGLDGTERDLVSRLAAKTDLTDNDIKCVKAMADRHLTPKRKVGVR